MKKTFTLLLLLTTFFSFAQSIVIDGNINDAGYQSTTSAGSGDCFGSSNNMTALKMTANANFIYIGIPADLSAANNIVIFFNFGGYDGRGPNAVLGGGGCGAFCTTSGTCGIYNAQFTTDIDYGIAFNKGNGATAVSADGIRWGTAGFVSCSYLGSSDQSGTTANLPNSGGSLSSAFGGDNTGMQMAWNNSGSSTGYGLEIKLPRTMFPGVSAGDNVQVLAMITSDVGFMSNETVPSNSNSMCYGPNPSISIPFTSAIVLPLTLTQIDVTKKGNTNSINWQTASEKDNAVFNVQRSTNNQTWATIGSVKATNNANGVKYNFIDETPLSTISYYRLQSVDFDGKMDYSKVVSVGGKDGKKTLSVYPNPVKTELNVLTDGNTEGVSIFNMTGQLVRQVNDNRSKVDVQDLPNGIYFVRLLDKNGLAGEAVRFVKQ